MHFNGFFRSSTAMKSKRVLENVAPAASSLRVNRARLSSRKEVLLADFQIESDRTLLPFSDLELDRITLIQVFDLISRGKAAAMKKNILATVIRRDEAKAFLPHDFFNRSGHKIFLLPFPLLDILPATP
jgi:hypothetical protein